MTPILPLVSACLSAAAPVSQRRPAIGAYEGWAKDVDVPGAKAVVPGIINYAWTGKAVVSVNGVTVKTVEIVDVKGQVDGLLVSLATWTNLSNSQHVITKPVLLPYPDAGTKNLCLGNWARFGSGEFRMDPQCLWPQFQVTGDGVRLKWFTPIEARWSPNGLLKKLFQRVTRTEIQAVTVTATGGTIEAPGLAGVVLPGLRWT